MQVSADGAEPAVWSATIRRYFESYRLRAIDWNDLEGQGFVTTLKWTRN